MDIAAGAFPTLPGQPAGACAPAPDGGFAAALALIGAGAEGAVDAMAAATQPSSVTPAAPDPAARLAAAAADATAPLPAPAAATPAAAVAAAPAQPNTAVMADSPTILPRPLPAATGPAPETALAAQPSETTISVPHDIAATDPPTESESAGLIPTTADVTASELQRDISVMPPSLDLAAAVAAPAAVAAAPPSQPAKDQTPAADRIPAATPAQHARARGMDPADRATDMPDRGVPATAPSPHVDASVQVEPAAGVAITAPRYGADLRQGRETPGSGAQTIDVAPDARVMSPGDAASSPPTAAPQEAPRAPPPSAPARQVLPAVVAVAIGGAGRITVTLEPGELGRVEISVERTGDAPQVVILAERPETLALLQRDQRELDRALTQAGLQAEGRGLSFGLSGGDTGSGQPQRRRDPATGDRAARGVQSPDATGSIAAAPARRVALSLLDLAI